MEAIQTATDAHRLAQKNKGTSVLVSLQFVLQSVETGCCLNLVMMGTRILGTAALTPAQLSLHTRVLENLQLVLLHAETVWSCLERCATTMELGDALLGVRAQTLDTHAPQEVPLNPQCAQ